MKKAVTWGGGLIALYLAVSYGTNTGRVISAGANGGAKIIRSFQGRN